jgi:predicted nuclease with TOPRIM domain
MREQTEPLGELVPLTKELRELVEPMPPTVERISAQAQPLDEMLPALDRLEQAVVERLEDTQHTMKALERDEAQLNKQVETLCGEIGDLKSIISDLKADVERITERLPDPTHGPLDKVRDVLSGGGQSSTSRD